MSKLRLLYCATSDLAEAAYLAMQPGAQLLKCEWEDEEAGIVRWVLIFDTRDGLSEEDLREARAVLADRQASVEPYSFMSKLRQVRIAMQRFLSEDGREIPRPQRMLTITETHKESAGGGLDAANSQ